MAMIGTGKAAGWRRWLMWLLVAPLALAGGLMVLWRLAPPVSTLMLVRYVTGAPVERTWISLEQIPLHLAQAVVASEDARFCQHSGVDWQALTDVLDEAGGPSRGASTLSMQTAKNLFLWNGRSYLRKGLELPLALVLDGLWPKRRIIEVYLNIAEWGDGIFGVEAAARAHFGISAAALTARQSALLASALPNPILRNPARAGRGQRRIATIIERRVRQMPAELFSCLGQAPKSSAR